jgi:VanZ family protein
MPATAFRLLFCALLAGMLYLALTPGPLRNIVPASEHRHVLAFAVLPIVSSLAWPRLSLRLQFAGYAVLGGAIEFAQSWMRVGRQGTVQDWLVDCVAAAAALFLVGMWRRLPQRETAASKQGL